MRQIVLQQREERDFLLKKTYQKRISQTDIKSYLNSGLIKLITGPRRSGKSVYALQLLENKNFAYLNFDDAQLLQEFDENVLMTVLSEIYPQYNYLLLDEVQNLPRWEMWVGKLYRRGINLIITGSNAQMLSGEMSTVLTGRYLQVEIFPFSLKELLGFRNIEISYETPQEKSKLLQQLNDYLQYGGFPETLFSREITRNYLSSLFDSILLKDITKRFNIRNSQNLYNLAEYLLTNYCNQFSISQLTADLGMGSKMTVQKFCGYLQEPYLFFYLPRFNNKLKLMLKAPLKVYVVDNGFIASHSFELSKNHGRLLENMVFVELLRRGYKAGDSLFYYRTKNEKEIDFVCRDGYKIDFLLQVSFDLQNNKTRKREISALIEACKELNCFNLCIITWDEENVIEENDYKITITPVWKWLLSVN